MKFTESGKKLFVPALLLAVLLMMVLPECAMAFSNLPLLVSAAPNIPANPSTIIVPDDYPSISAAIGNASAGDTIFVRSGTYFDNPVIDKPLTLQGENSANTMVVGTGGVAGASVLTVTADDVKISGFTIESVNYSASANDAYGVMVEADNCAITGNNIVNTLSGVFCSVQSSAFIGQNSITGNYKDGIRFYGGSNNTFSANTIVGNAASGIAIEGYSDNITGNIISQNTIGIGLAATYSTIFRNNITQNSNAGIYLPGSNNIISANYVADNKYGVYGLPSFGLCSNNKIVHNDFVDNNLNANLTLPYFIEVWDDGYPLGGNYWSDYSTVCPNATEIANSGIMNLPYTICANNTDNDPLMAPFNVSTAVAPIPETSSEAGSNHIAALWSFDSIGPNDVTPDSTGSNPAVVGTMAANVSFAPQLVEGKFGEALYFDGNAYAYVPASPSLTIPNDITIDAWVDVSQFKNVTYNTVIAEAVGSTSKYSTRIVGLAFNGVPPTNSTAPPLGALRGYVTTDTGGFNEIMTTQAVIPLNVWTHVVFTRSTQTGMHLYVNGVEQNVTVTAGTQNPEGSILQDTGMYIGHDSISTLENVQILNVAAPPTSTPIWQLWWFWTPIAAAFAILAGTVYYVSKKDSRQNKVLSKSSHP